MHPHTFFNYIFFNKTKYKNNEIPTEVYLHEQTHAKQKHALDILFIEVLQIVFWFNPLLYFIKKDIKLNHEFLADQAVLKQGIASSTYQKTLLAFSSNASYSPLANAIHYSSIKKRFTVMKTHTSKKAIWLRCLIILPLLAILIYSFSDKKVVEKPYVLQVINNENGISEALMKEYREFIINTEATKVINFPKHQRAVAIYDLMTEKQRNSVKKYPENIVPDITKAEPKTPTETEFNSWKDSNKFAVWIDDKPVKNSALDNYKVSDIKYFTTSFVYNNARSNKFPQPYQNHLYTKKGFEESYLKRNVEKYNGLKAEYLKANKENNLNSDELKILKAQLDRAFENLTKEEIEKYNIIKVPTIITNTNDSQQKANQDIVEEYKKKYNELEILKKTSPHYVYKAKTEQEKMNTLFSDLGGMYFRMTKAHKQSVSRPEAPILPYTKLIRDGKEEYKKISELTEEDKKLLPPPPPPLIGLEPKNISKELLEAKKKFKEKGDVYGNAMQPYLKEGKGNISELRKMYDDVMVLYNEYSDLAKKENVSTLPPPPPVKK